MFVLLLTVLGGPTPPGSRRGLQLFFLASAFAWGGAAMYLRGHFFWRFSWPGLLLGEHIITDFIVLFVSIKAAMDLLSIARLLQLKCAYFIAQ